MNWRDITYLKTGTDRQREVYALLCSSQVLSLLDPFDPVLVSTICIGLDIEGSDLDIICSFKDRTDFEIAIEKLFKNYKNFNCRRLPTPDGAVVAQFTLEGFEIEIYGATTPVEEQNGYRHLTAMHKLLRLGGEDLREAIIREKRAGIKTEPAVASALCLSGDPYAAVLNLNSKSDDELDNLIKNRPISS